MTQTQSRSPWGKNHVRLTLPARGRVRNAGRCLSLGQPDSESARDSITDDNPKHDQANPSLSVVVPNPSRHTASRLQAVTMLIPRQKEVSLPVARRRGTAKRDAGMTQASESGHHAGLRRASGIRTTSVSDRHCGRLPCRHLSLSHGCPSLPRRQLRGGPPSRSDSDAVGLRDPLLIRP